MEAPVVVNPEVDSKIASINEGIEPLIKYGIAPNKENKIQESVTTRYPSRRLNSFKSAFFDAK
jgi:hypothetical protein